MRRRAVLFGVLLPLLFVTIVGAQSLTSIPTDPAGARGSATLCYNAVAIAWQPCSVANPLQVGGVTFPATQNVNVQQWGGAATTLGQKAMVNSLPVTMASDQPAMPISGTVTISGTVVTPSALQGMVFSQSPSFTVTPVALAFMGDYTVLGVQSAGQSKISFNRGQNYINAGSLANITNIRGLAVQGAVALVGGTTNAGAPPRVWRSVNGGTTWSTINLGAGGGIDSCGPNISGTTAIIQAAGGIFRSTNTGASWVLQQAIGGNCGTGMSDTEHLSGNTWLSADGQEIFRSTNDGVAWASVLNHGGGSGVRLASPNWNAPAGTVVVYAVFSSDLNIYRSADSGATWGIQRTMTNALNGITCPSASICVATDTSALIYRSLDAGITWLASGTMPQNMGCATMCSSDHNSLGDIVWQMGVGGGLAQTAFSNLALQGQQTLVGPDGALVGTASNPVRVDPTGTTGQPVSGTVTANQGAAAASPAPWPVGLVQGPTLFNSQTTGAADTAVTVTIANVASVRAHVYAVHAFCSAGTSTLTLTDGGTTIWGTTVGEITTARFQRIWTPGLTGATASQVVITLATCGVANTGTLHVQADRF